MNRKGSTWLITAIVLAIVLIAIVIFLFNAQPQTASPDAHRLSDLNETQKGLQLYWNKNGSYPNASTWSIMSADLISAGIGITQVPNDPKTGATYYYQVGTNGSTYIIGAKLEDPHNVVFMQYVVPSGKLPSGLTCAAADQEFCLSP